MLHHFTRSIAHIALPDKFTYPFHYTPHPLCVMAADEVQVYLQHQAQWQDELQQGKCSLPEQTRRKIRLQL